MPKKESFKLLQNEKVFYKDNPHVSSILGKYILTAISLLICLFWFRGIWKLLFVFPVISFVYFTKKREGTQVLITNRRIFIREGVFTREDRNIELQKISDFRVSRSFSKLIIKLTSGEDVADIHIRSTDAFSPTLILEGIRDPDDIAVKLQNNVEIRKKELRVIYQDKDR